ncbi:MAG: HD domain-containing protein [Dehalococcoidia bacterium]|nr:HD domain-containing protein [Dehalococcoidia bacterium]MDD5494148.1 HD domain-containing protein [Dehalococcoidia bacterium]
MEQIDLKAIEGNYKGTAAAYFTGIFLALLAIALAVSVLIYFQALAFISADIMQSAINGMMLPVALSAIFLALVLAAVAWLLTALILHRTRSSAQLRLYGQLLDISPDSVFLHDLNGACLYANEAACRLAGAAPAGGDKLKAAAGFRLLDRDRIKELVENSEITFEYISPAESGSNVQAEVHSRIIQLNRKKFIISSARDIKERKMIEEELKQSSQKLRRAMEGTIQSMALTSETRDPYTAGHQNRVSRLACAIGREMGLPENQIEGIRVSGTLHDIGKIYVPAEILSKPGKLRQNEINLLRDHAEVGYELLQNIEFAWPVAEIVYQHHERMDGSGYPRGLKGDQIMLEARIMCVADVVEAMASHRPYRPAFSIEKALLEILQKRDLLYDGKVVDACLRLFNEKQYKLD